MLEPMTCCEGHSNRPSQHAAGARAPLGTSNRLLLFIYSLIEREKNTEGSVRRWAGEGGKGWKSMPELISGIDNLTKGLTAPIHCPRARRGCPRHGRLLEGRPQPG